MSERPMLSRRGPRILLWSLAVGLLFAAVSGGGVQASGSAGVNRPPVASRIERVFAPELALLGFPVGAGVGALIVALWGRSGLGHVAAVVLVALVAGLAGMVVAAEFGAETRTFGDGRSEGSEYEVPSAVLAAGAVVGLTIGTLGAWVATRRFRAGNPRGFALVPSLLIGLALILILRGVLDGGIVGVLSGEGGATPARP